MTNFVVKSVSIRMVDVPVTECWRGWLCRRPGWNCCSQEERNKIMCNICPFKLYSGLICTGKSALKLCHTGVEFCRQIQLNHCIYDRLVDKRANYHISRVLSSIQPGPMLHKLINWCWGMDIKSHPCYFLQCEITPPCPQSNGGLAFEVRRRWVITSHDLF